MANDLFSREQLAGYDPEVLKNAVVGIIGAGALANNVEQTLALAGVRETRIVDFDVIEPSNATRSPMFPRHAALGSKKRWKARELGQAALRTSYADAPIVRYAVSRVEALGLGALADCDVVIVMVDSFLGRAWVADATRLLGVPLVEGGFSGSQGNVSVYLNDTDESPCYRCLHPNADHGASASCSLYARGVINEGAIPATQSIAALTGAYVAEAAIRLLHPKGSGLAHKFLGFNVDTGKSSLMSLATDPDCQGVHRRIREIRGTQVTANDPLRALWDVVPEFENPELVLPTEYLVEAPCAHCGRRVSIHRPDWLVTSPPACTKCLEDENSGSPVHVVTRSVIKKGDRLEVRKCRKFGIAPLDIVELRDAATGQTQWVELAGCLDDLFVTLRKDAEPRSHASADFVPAPAGEQEVRELGEEIASP